MNSRPSERLLDAATLGEKLAGKSARTGRRFMDQGHVPIYLVGGKRYVRESELEAWLEEQRIVQDAPKQDLKGLLTAISDRVLAERKHRAGESSRAANPENSPP